MKFLLALLFLTASSTFAQPYYRGDVEFALDSSLSTAFPVQTGLMLAGHLEAGYDLELSDLGLADASPVAFSLVLDPSLRVSQVVTTEPGFTELYATTTYGDLDLSAGVERLPLETARSSVPYSVETVGVRGIRHGVPGVRGVLYSGDWRLRGAVFYQGATNSVVPLVSVKRAFDSFELEAHVLYQDGIVAGLGGSGLVSDIVVYGEAWLLTDPLFTGKPAAESLSGRGALGLSGNLELGTWTLEAAYLTPGETSLKEDDELTPAQHAPTTDPHPAVSGQVVLPLGDKGEMSLLLTGNAFFDPDAVRPGVGASYTLLTNETELTLGAGARFGPEPAAITVNVSVKQFF